MTVSLRKKEGVVGVGGKSSDTSEMEVAVLIGVLAADEDADTERAGVRGKVGDA